jgi:hypothetical protein
LLFQDLVDDFLQASRTLLNVTLLCCDKVLEDEVYFIERIEIGVTRRVAVFPSDREAVVNLGPGRILWGTKICVVQ